MTISKILTKATITYLFYILVDRITLYLEVRMQNILSLLFSGTVLISTCWAHLSLKSPPPLGSRHNPYSPTRDWSLTSPLKDAASFPCKQYHKLDSHGAGHSVAVWPAGSTQGFTLEGSAWHGGGSCQLSLSYDGGRRWKVIRSFIAGCPSGPPDENPQYASATFTVPAEARPGEALFAWTWFNRIGNREMYMSCAAVTITNQNAASALAPSDGTPMSPAYEAHWEGGLLTQNMQMQTNDTSGIDSFPDILVAQLPGLSDCSIPGGEQVEFPHPGRDVQRGEGRTMLPKGSCEYPTVG